MAKKDTPPLNHLAAADAIRNAIRPYRALNEFADQLEALGSAEQARQVAERENAAAQEQLAKTRELVAAEEAKLAAAKATVEDEARVNAGLAAETIRRAQEEAVAIKDKAKTDAEQIINKATAKGVTEKAALDAKLSETQAKVLEANELWKKALDGLADAQNELATVTGQIEAAKAKLRELLS